MFDFLKKKITEVKEALFKKIEKPKEEVPQPEQEITAEKEILKTEKKVVKKDVGLVTKIKKAVIGTVKISEKEIDELLEDFKLSLLEADVASSVTDEICDNLKKNLVETEFKRNEEISLAVDKSIKQTIEDILSSNKTADIVEMAKSKKPFIILFLGPNGAGKTTTMAKVCKMFLENNMKCVFSASDTFRAASIEQLEEHANKLGVKVIKQQYGTDPTAVAFDTVKYAQANKIDVVLIDSAGRQETNTNLIEQIKKMDRVIKPDLKVFVGEAITGNAIVEQVRAYADTIGLNGAILSKLDIDSKGGAILSIIKNNVPILYFGTGQGYKDIQKFDKNYLLKKLFEE